jgi:hypothetical protein
MADLADGFGGFLKPSRKNGPETNRNHAETSMKPSETKVAGHKRNRETAPLQGRSLVSPPAAFGARARPGRVHLAILADLAPPRPRIGSQSLRQEPIMRAATPPWLYGSMLNGHDRSPGPRNQPARSTRVTDHLASALSGTSGGRGSSQGMRSKIGAKGAMPRTADDAAKTPAERMRSYRQRQRRQWRSVGALL